MRTLSRHLNRTLEATLALLLAGLVLLVAADTLLWAFLSVSYPQVAEVQSILQIWFGLLAAAYGVKQGFHLGLEFTAQRLQPGSRHLLERGVALTGIVLGILLLRYGAALTFAVDNTLPATGLPASVQYQPTWVAGLLIIFFALERLIYGDPKSGQETQNEETRG